LQAWGIPTGYHPHQLHVAEFCACKTVEIILNIDLGVESRSTAKTAAQKHTRLHLQHDDDGGAGEPASNAQPPLVFEDVGGQVVSDDEEPNVEDPDEKNKTRMLVMDKVQDVKWVQRLLAREIEVAQTLLPGRTSDNSKAMEKVSSVYGTTVTELLEPFHAESKDCFVFHIAAPVALELQSRRAESVRRQCDVDGIDAAELDAEHVHRSTTSAPSVECFDVDDVLVGPRQVAWKLCQAASLNLDQTRAIALVAQPMQAAWEKHVEL